jgi:hypothetical protein
VSRYPEDPRGYLFRGMNALDAHDYARAIADLRTGLQKNEGLQTVLPPSVEDLLRANLALAQGALGNMSDAKATARPVCVKDPSNSLRQALTKTGPVRLNCRPAPNPATDSSGSRA